jgi:hypothetical protein
LDGLLAGLLDLAVLERDATEQSWHHGRNAHVQRGVHIAAECAHRIVFLSLSGGGRGGGSAEDVQGDRTLQGGPIWKAAVQRGNADTGAASDLVERRVGTQLDEHIARGGQDLLPITARVGAQRAPPLD